MVGFGAPRRGSRLPPTVLLVLLAVLGLLAFNYWSARGRQADLATELGALQTQAERTEVARTRLERRNSELVLLLEQHRSEARKEHEQRVSTEQRLAESLERQARMQTNVSRLLVNIAHLKEQHSDLNQAFLQREDLIRELQINNTALLSRREQSSLQCEEQLQKLKVQYEDSLKKFPPAAAEIAVLEQPGEQLDSSRVRGPNLDEIPKNKVDIDAVKNQDLIKGSSKIQPPNAEEIKTGESDAGMPELEENVAANLHNIPSALKKPSLLAHEAVVNLSSVHPQDAKLALDAVAPAVLLPEIHGPPQDVHGQPLEMQNKLLMESSLKNLLPKKRSGNVPALKQNDEERDAVEDPADYRKDSLKNGL